MNNGGHSSIHELSRGEEKDKQRKNAEKVLAKAKEQESSKNGRFVWDQEQRAYFFKIV